MFYQVLLLRCDDLKNEHRLWKIDVNKKLIYKSKGHLCYIFGKLIETK